MAGACLTAAAFSPTLCAGRRPAFSANTVTVLGRQSLAELAAEAANMAAAAAAASAAGGYAGAQGAPSPSTISKSLLALTVLASGAPVVPQDAVADLADAHFVGVLMRQRRRLAHLLLPPRFDSPRDIRWHGADAAVEPLWDAGRRTECAWVATFCAACLPDSCVEEGRRTQGASQPCSAPLCALLLEPGGGCSGHVPCSTLYLFVHPQTWPPTPQQPAAPT